MDESAGPLHILVMTDRDWTHPQAGGTGANLFGQVSRWVAWGHRVSVIASAYPGAASFERIADGLEVHRMGGRSTVFPRAILAQARGRVPDADVVLEVVNGITFLTPLWLRTPRVALVHHVHRDHYVKEMGRTGKLAAYLLETAPLRHLYRDSRFLTISHSSARDLSAHGIPLEQIEVGYIGVELDAFGADESRRAEDPTLLYLGRLKRYKRIEVVLDALEACPDAMLDVAGDGDHRDELVAEIERRGLTERVRMHGHVSEELKHELYQRAWLNMTASSAEGWCLTVMEAAASGTPSAALAVGGLPESIVDGETGVLADDPDELVARTREVMHDEPLRRRFGDAALARAQEFTWDATAERTLAVLRAERDRALAREPEAARRAAGWRPAAGLAAALAANNLIALVVTVLFARALGVAEYGSLGALLAAFALLALPAVAVQAAVAREVADGSVGSAGVRRWLRQAAVATVALAAASALLRRPLADLVGVGDEWGAACVPPAAGLFLMLSLARGALQGAGRNHAVGLSLVGEAAARLVLGVSLVAAGAGITGAFLGTPLGLLLTLGALAAAKRGSVSAVVAERAGPPLRWLLARAWAPLAAFFLLAALQNLDVIFVARDASGPDTGAYVAASTAAKATIWIALGLSVYLLPLAVRRVRAGGDARPILAGTLGLLALVALPAAGLYAVAGEPLLRALFGDADYARAAGALPLLALAMALLGAAYVCVQYLLALRRQRFTVVLGLAALAEPLVLTAVGAAAMPVARTLVVLQLAVAALVLAIAMRRAPAGPAPAAA